MLSWLSSFMLPAVGGLRDLRERALLDPPATRLALLARFVDEFASGLAITLLPTLRRAAGASVGQVGIALQVMDLVAGVTDPAAGIAVDLWRRRPLLVLGAAGWSLALLSLAGLPGLAGLIVGFAVIGAGSGALCHTADVVLVEGYPHDAERISTISTIIDSVGALLAPLLVAVLFARNGDARVPLALTGVAVAAYAVALARASWPAAPQGRRDDRQHLMPEVLSRARAVLNDRRARLWLGVLLLDSALDITISFTPLWLADVAGFSQSLVGVHATVELAASLFGLMVLDRLLQRFDGVVVLRWALAALLVLYPAWLLAGGIAARLVLVALRNVAAAPIWPIARARALASVPGSAGTVGSIQAVMSLLPATLLFGWAAERIDFTGTMLVVTIGAALMMLLLVLRAPRS